MSISAPIAGWETWTGLSFPDNGSYVFAKGLAPLTVTDGTGQYGEPNVQMLHTVE
jgi:hypothetical protein